MADHFSRAERPRAASIYMLGGSLSFVIGYFVAGWLNEFYGWRTTFMLLGLPGLPLGLLACFTLREPRRGGARVEDTRSSPQPSLKEVCVALWENTTFRHVLMCTSVVYFFGYGIGQWQATFFVRSYGLQTGELGTWLAAIYGVGGLVGTYVGGAWASRRAARNERLQLKVMGIVYASFGAVSALIYLSPNLYMAFGLLAFATVGGATIHGPLLATIQTLVPDRMRATSIAIVYLFANLIGMGLGPLAAGASSDLLRPWVGEESLRYSLLILCPGYLWGGWHLLRASRTVNRDLAASQADPDREITAHPVPMNVSARS
jgi:MFS family permease